MEVLCMGICPWLAIFCHKNKGFRWNRPRIPWAFNQVTKVIKFYPKIISFGVGRCAITTSDPPSFLSLSSLNCSDKEWFPYSMASCSKRSISRLTSHLLIQMKSHFLLRLLQREKTFHVNLGFLFVSWIRTMSGPFFRIYAWRGVFVEIA